MSETVIVIGSGAREHAIAWKLAQSPRVGSLICAPGNPGTSRVAENVPIGVTDSDAIAALAVSRKASLVMVGPEAPLAAGLADRLIADGIPVCGPTQKAAQIESSKSWAKALMLRAGVPTARSIVVTDTGNLATAVDQFDFPLVLKADGLAAGKGVIIANDRREALETGAGLLSGTLLGVRSASLVVEEFLFGYEVSVLALTDGSTIIPLIPATDYKRALDGDVGPNTGGMGAFAPVPEISDAMAGQIRRDILEPTIAAMAEAGAPMQGVLYAGLMMTNEGPKVLEFNARLGDPETEVILPLLDSDVFELLLATAVGALSSLPRLRWSEKKAVCVVLASSGYPGSYPTGLPIDGAGHDTENAIVFHAGTALDAAGRLVTAGGRVLTVTGIGDTFDDAASRAYARARKIAFEGMQFRTDIARRLR